MALDVNNFVRGHAHLFHMAAAGAWPRIQTHGLLSTKALIAHLAFTPEDAFALREARKRGSQTRVDLAGDRFTFRDQCALKLSQFPHVLNSDTTVNEWLDMLDERVFLWADRKRLLELRRARNYKRHPQTLLTFDTSSLFEDYNRIIEVADMNSGAVLYPNAPSRGKGTFQSIDSYQHGKRDIVEVTIPGSIVNIHRYVIQVDDMDQDGRLQNVWTRKAASEENGFAAG